MRFNLRQAGLMSGLLMPRTTARICIRPVRLSLTYAVICFVGVAGTASAGDVEGLYKAAGDGGATAIVANVCFQTIVNETGWFFGDDVISRSTG